MKLWWIIISWSSCPCIQLLSGGLAYMFYEYYLCKVVKKGIKMLSIHHCQLLVRLWNKFIRMWHKGTTFFPFALFTSWYKTVSLNTFLLEKNAHNRFNLRKKEKCIFLCVSRDAVHHDGRTYVGRRRRWLVTLCPLWRNRGWWIMVFNLLSSF